MPLFVNETVVSSDNLRTLRTFIESFQCLKNKSQEFIKKPVSSVGPVGLVYVDQREYAVVTTEDEYVSIVGSEDATTCHIVVIRHSGSGVTCLAHIDSCDVLNDIKTMVNDVKSLSGGKDGRLQLHVVGGFEDDRKCSEEISLALLNIFHSLEESIYLETACMTCLNNVVKGEENWPIVYGIGFDVRRGSIFPAKFPEKGPDMALRGARHFTGSHELLKIYDSTVGILTIGPFNYKYLQYADHIARQPDDWIRQNMSTSPKVEPPHFADRVRTTLKQFMEHPKPLETVFKQNKPRQYRKQHDGSWKIIK